MASNEDGNDTLGLKYRVKIKSNLNWKNFFSQKKKKFRGIRTHDDLITGKVKQDRRPLRFQSLYILREVNFGEFQVSKTAFLPFKK